MRRKTQNSEQEFWNSLWEKNAFYQERRWTSMWFHHFFKNKFHFSLLGLSWEFPCCEKELGMSQNTWNLKYVPVNTSPTCPKRLFSAKTMEPAASKTSWARRKELKVRNVKKSKIAENLRSFISLKAKRNTNFWWREIWKGWERWEMSPLSLFPPCNYLGFLIFFFFNQTCHFSWEEFIHTTTWTDPTQHRV